MPAGHGMQAWSRLAHTGPQPGVCYVCLRFVYNVLFVGGVLPLQPEPATCATPCVVC
jgi:hypothetical protein